MIEVYGLMLFFGLFGFFAGGLILAFSIESNESRILEKIIQGFTAISLICFLVGIFGLIIIKLFF